MKVEEVKPTLVIIDSCERVVPSETFTSKELDELNQFVDQATAADALSARASRPPGISLNSRTTAPSVSRCAVLTGIRSW